MATTAISRSWRVWRARRSTMCRCSWCSRSPSRWSTAPPAKAPTTTKSSSIASTCPSSPLAAAVSRLASSDVRYREMGRRFGDRADYGHIDLLVGRSAPEEVYPVLLDFLEEVD